MDEHSKCPTCGAPLLTNSNRERISLNVMLYIGGNKTAFRCECGSSVFSHFRDEQGDVWVCHGCYREYCGTAG